MPEKKFVPLKERPTGPVRTFDETEILKSSNTWEFPIFEQLRAIRFIQQGLFSEPKNVKFHLLNLLVSLNHLETMLYDRINPSYDKDNESWKDYQKRKPNMFKNMHMNTDRISEYINSNELEQFKLMINAEIWLRALDKYLNSIKRISPTVFEMKVPDAMTAQFADEPDEPVSSGMGKPAPKFVEGFLDNGVDEDESD